jgi:hypothetical protein
MKLTITLGLLLCFSTSFSQWTRVQQLPSSDIASLYHKDSILYAGGKNIIYISKDKGLTWDSTSSIPQLFLVTSLIVYKNELYAAAPNKGVFKSSDGGTTWQNISAGIFPDVSDFCEFRGDLYAATLGNSIYKLNPVNRNSWLFFSEGLSSLSININAIAGNSNALVAGTNNNALYDYLPANTTTWEERFLLGQISPNEGAYDIITAHDTLFYAGHTGKYYMSTDNGLNWNLFGNRLISAATSIVNARQALLSSIHFFDGFSFSTAFFYIKKDSLQNPFVNFSVATGHFTYKIDILGDKLWDASNKGLFYMSLSDLPGISPADDSLPPVLLPVHFSLFNTSCEGNKLLLTWDTEQEQNSNRFEIERSTDNIQWTVIGNLPAAGNSNSKRSYSFTDNNPVNSSVYRIAEIDLDGRVYYTGVIRPFCAAADVFSLWPNPVHDRINISMVTPNKSRVMLKLFDSEGLFVKEQQAAILPGSNLLSMNVEALANGVYFLSMDWDNGQKQKTVKLLKK